MNAAKKKLYTELDITNSNKCKQTSPKTIHNPIHSAMQGDSPRPLQPASAMTASCVMLSWAKEARWSAYCSDCPQPTPPA